MKKSDVVPALLMLVLSAALAFETRGLSFWADTTPGPAFLPAWLAIAGLALVVLRLVESRRAPGAGIEWPDRPAVTRVAMILGGLVGVPLLSPLAGLVPALALFVAYLLLAVLRQPLGPSLATLAVTVGLVYGIFVGWLGVPLPKGILGI
jgi:putative tricarboxylic transport membrane protein